MRNSIRHFIQQYVLFLHFVHSAKTVRLKSTWLDADRVSSFILFFIPTPCDVPFPFTFFSEPFRSLCSITHLPFMRTSSHFPSFSLLSSASAIARTLPWPLWEKKNTSFSVCVFLSVTQSVSLSPSSLRFPCVSLCQSISLSLSYLSFSSSLLFSLQVKGRCQAMASKI